MAGMRTHERREEIVRLAKTTGLASVEELADTFDVTASTIRRDLARLTEEGRVARTYGGAMVLQAHPEPSLLQRTEEAFAEKQAMARWAAAEIVSGETILLDAGTTVGALARELRDGPTLTVATTSLTALGALAGSQTVHVECLGGTLRHLSQGFVGPLAEAALERMTFDRVYLGADGVTPQNGLCEADLQQTRLKELMIRRSNAVYVLAHAQKLGRSPFHSWVRLPSSWTLVTDTSAHPGLLAEFTACGASVVTVPPAGP